MRGEYNYNNSMWKFESLKPKDETKSWFANTVLKFFIDVFAARDPNDYEWSSDEPDLEITKEKKLITIRYTCMYTAPKLDLALLKQISDFFGTNDIHIDEISQSGCETCNYGSAYGHTIYIRNATKNDYDYQVKPIQIKI